MKFHTLTEEEQIEIIKRRLICAACPFMSSNAVSNPSLNYKTKRIDQHCIWCGCPIEVKTASLSANCGIEDYNEEHPDQPMDLKWKAFIKPNNDEQVS